MTDSCIFCRIIQGELPGSFVFQDQQIVAFLDLNQLAQGHLLVMPRQHVGRFTELDSETAQALMAKAAALAKGLYRALGCDGMNLLINDGAAAGQDVPHLHLHLFPRWQADGLIGRMGLRRVAERDELEQRAAQIRKALEQA